MLMSYIPPSKFRFIYQVVCIPDNNSWNCVLSSRDKSLKNVIVDGFYFSSSDAGQVRGFKSKANYPEVKIVYKNAKCNINKENFEGKDVMMMECREDLNL